MLKELLKILGQDKAKAVDLRNALDALDAGLPELEQSVRSAEQRRTGLLLDPRATDQAHDNADDALRLAVRDRDRAHAARVELSKKLEQAEAAEFAAALDARRNAVEREAITTAKALHRFMTLQNEMCAILSQLEKAEEKVEQVNVELAAAGRTDLLDPVEPRTIPVPEGQFSGFHSIRNRTVLKEMANAPGWRDSEPAFPMSFGPSAAALVR